MPRERLTVALEPLLETAKGGHVCTVCLLRTIAQMVRGQCDKEALAAQIDRIAAGTKHGVRKVAVPPHTCEPYVEVARRLLVTSC